MVEFMLTRFSSAGLVTKMPHQFGKLAARAGGGRVVAIIPNDLQQALLRAGGVQP
jgi:hypothetical protein